nr:MAG TPA: hypothetical protein [Caudoviricetes sp.]
MRGIIFLSSLIIQRTSFDSIARERRERKGLFCAYSTGYLASNLTIGV